MSSLDCLELALLKRGISVERCDNHRDKRYPKPISARFRWTKTNQIIMDWPFPDLMKAFLREFYDMN